MKIDSSDFVASFIFFLIGKVKITERKISAVKLLTFSFDHQKLILGFRGDMFDCFYIILK